MPNQPRPDNPARTVRIDDSLWVALRRIAAAEQVVASVIIRRALTAFVNTYRGTQ
jgi:predicted transcriptional regulator